MILTTLRATIVDLGFQHTYRQNPTEFSRKRTLSFPIIVVVGLINLFNRSIAVELTKLLGHLHGLTAPFCSKQAFSKQPQKLKPEAFVALNDQLIQQFYADGAFAKFHGFRLLAIDGSTLQLSESQEIVQHYGRSSNQTSCIPMARCSLVHDVQSRNSTRLLPETSVLILILLEVRLLEEKAWFMKVVVS